MSGVSIGIRIEDKEVREMLGNLSQRAQNLKPAMSIIGQIVRGSVIKNFESGGRPQKWRLSGRARKEGGKTLVDRARLQNSVNAKAFSSRVEIGTNVVYGAIHQFGGKAGRGKKVTIPARPYLMVQDEDWPTIRAAITDYLLKGAQ